MSGMNEQALLDVLDRIRNKYFGKYRGTVTDVDASTLRIKAKVPAVLGKQATGWCMPCVPYAGDVSYPIWTGCYWRSGEQPSDAAPAVKAIVTKAGHKILLDDDAGSITISDSNENKITMDSSGLTLERGSQKVVISDSEVSVNDGALEVM
jgi:hypothetical protein